MLDEYCLLKKLNSFPFYSFLQWLHFIRANVIQQIYIYIDLKSKGLINLLSIFFSSIIS